MSLENENFPLINVSSSNFPHINVKTIQDIDNMVGEPAIQGLFKPIGQENDSIWKDGGLYSQ